MEAKYHVYTFEFVGVGRSNPTFDDLQVVASDLAEAWKHGITHATLIANERGEKLFAMSYMGMDEANLDAPFDPPYIVTHPAPLNVSMAHN